MLTFLSLEGNPVELQSAELKDISRRCPRLHDIDGVSLEDDDEDEDEDEDEERPRDSDGSCRPNEEDSGPKLADENLQTPRFGDLYKKAVAGFDSVLSSVNRHSQLRMERQRLAHL